MVLLQVEVPAGLAAGDEMTLTYEGHEFTVVVPDGVSAGQLLDLDLPVDAPPEPAESSEQLTVVIPDGLLPGDAFAVLTEWGVEFEVVVPEGCAPGQAIEVTLPRPAADAPPEDSATHSAAAAAAHPLPPGYNADDFQFKPGQRVEVWRSGDAYSGGTIVHGWEGWDGPMYKVEMDAGVFKEAVPEEEISAAVGDVGDLFDGM
ncbi:hypothetical protein AB1Y20_014982 [Prymnesium parvum]|uniref:Peptidylprolyl isomerase n=1 Tax=Prymnesium parvum TaxID=97485 RepID=A0AB34JVS8_PRYPA